VGNLHSQIKAKLGVNSDIELVRLALRQGLLMQAAIEALRA
jgi:DNA-binding CsgD family transcriptional regulator